MSPDALETRAPPGHGNLYLGCLHELRECGQARADDDRFKRSAPVSAAARLRHPTHIADCVGNAGKLGLGIGGVDSEVGPAERFDARWHLTWFAQDGHKSSQQVEAQDALELAPRALDPL